MSSTLALTICTAGVAGLFYLDRDKSARTSSALWLPVIWLLIICSRPASEWLGIWFGIHLGPSIQGTDAQVDGSPADAAIFAVLLAAGVAVLFRKSNRAKSLLKANYPILIYFGFCLLSVLWSPLPDIACKRWIKAIGDLVMVLVVAAETDPIVAIRRLFSRLGFILLPFSIYLIRYSDLGRGFNPDGGFENVGVTTNKNSLGLVTFLLSLGIFWNFLQLVRGRRKAGRNRQLVAQGVVLLSGIALLMMAHSATSGSCFTLGVLLMLATGLPAFRRQPRAVHGLVITVLVLGGLFILFGGEAAAVHAVGRNSNFTGRTDIWKATIPACPNPLIGAGFESFWIGPDRWKVWSHLKGWIGGGQVNEAHNGYIEVYINLGLVGLGLIAAILISTYMRAVASFRREPAAGALMLAFVTSSAIYSVTEAGFRMLCPIWVILLLAGTTSSGIVSGVVGSRASRPVRKGADPRAGLATGYASSLCSTADSLSRSRQA